MADEPAKVSPERLEKMRRHYEKEHYNRAWIEQRMQELSELSGDEAACINEEYMEVLDYVHHKGEITLCEVMANNLGDTHYAFYLQDTLNLKKPAGFTVMVRGDGSLEFFEIRDAEVVADLLNRRREQIEAMQDQPNDNTA